MSATLAGVLLSAAWTFQYWVFHLPPILSVAVAGAVCNLAFMGTLVWLGRRNLDDRANAVRVLLTWAIICPFVAALVAWLVRGVTLGADEELISRGLSSWSLEINTHFITQAAWHAFLGVACAAWLLARAATRRSG